MKPRRTAYMKLADLLLSEPVEVWAKRHAEDDRSWPWIARRLTRDTGGQIEVAGETVRTWVAAFDAEQRRQGKRRRRSEPEQVAAVG